MGNKVLVAYYSHSGNTEKIANAIQTITGGTIFKIEPLVAYPTSYNVVVEQAKNEINKGYMPELKNNINNLEEFDIVYLGTPNWWSTIAPPVAKFLLENDLSGKIIAPFCTHGGGGLSGIQREIKKACSDTTIAESFVVYGSGGSDVEELLTNWIKKVDKR